MTGKEQFKFKRIAEMTGREMFCVAKLRIDTFVTEQKITDPELDDDDLIAIQVYLLNDDDSAAQAVCRLFKEDGKWMLGRVAVAQKARGQHLGTKMLSQVHEYLQNKGVNRLYCHAQMQAKPFYDYLGYQAQGEVFTEAGVKHIMMYYDL
ncbi:GNAT family N-acetyltransferase [Lactobacillus sp. ESL0684]|uniref:GNAT family N-acetyltransferase n=1 Tax=Lactobacillus sp. ESL0684 TaxID=2983213 RepID=UPI0023F85EF0|nr:GNAT family N-acetyltransferase [Lactobacillus sp. ESL0684]WEV43822.1 GNAT family N-acetyltransferase [Lactobacillus sp. ESL0684]